MTTQHEQDGRAVRAHSGVRSVIALIVMLGAVVCPVDAQQRERPRTEIGVQSAVAWVRADAGDDWVSVISVPGSSTFGIGALYATLWAGPTTAVEPQFALTRTSSNGFSNSLVHLNLQLMQFFSDPETRSAYGAIQVGAVSSAGSNGSSRTGWIAGGAIGHRWIVRESLGVRLEGRYRRWFSEDVLERDEVAVILGLGAVLGR